MKKIIAVIVSYNRHTQLVACVEAIRQQTKKPDAVLVVNNGSSDYTTVWLDQQNDVEQIYQENSGSGGGYHAGISWAYQNNYDWIWCMGDDGYPKNTALEFLLHHANNEPCLLNSVAINMADKNTLVWPTKKYNTLNEVHEETISGIAHLFNGSLIHRSIVSKVGYPNKQLFYKGVASEYFYRITKNNSFEVKTVLQSIYYHTAPQDCFQYKWDFKEDIAAYFYIRNRLSVLCSKHNHTIFSVGKYLLFLSAFVLLLFKNKQSEKRKKINLILLGAVDAFTNNYSASPNSIQRHIQNQYQLSLYRRISNSIKKFALLKLVPSYTEMAPSRMA